MAFDKKKYIQNYVKENYKRVALEYLLINCTYNLIFPLLQDPD